LPNGPQVHAAGCRKDDEYLITIYEESRENEFLNKVEKDRKMEKFSGFVVLYFVINY
jgi:hypothetical protein